MTEQLAPHEFRLTPHVLAILKGRGMCKGERLLCSASRCLFQPAECKPDSDYGRDIEIKGYGICPRCKAKTDYAVGIEWNDVIQAIVMRCNICKTRIPKKAIVWTQIVIPKHRKNKHYYFHKECYDAMFLDIPDEEGEEEEESLYYGYVPDGIIKILKWIGRVESCL